jgi:hypothetical protein
MAHHHSDPIVVPQRFGRQIAKHPQMAMLTVNAVFRGMMRMERCHGFEGILIYSSIARIYQA